MVLHQVLRDKDFSKINRHTVDIDCNWIENTPSMDVLLEIVSRSLRNIQENLSVQISREYTPDSTACLSIIDSQENAKVFKIDISIAPVLGEKLYHFENISFRGVLPTEIFCDKIFVLSGQRVLRRSKDVLDVYLLANCEPADTNAILSALKEKEHFPLDSFDVFLNRTADLKHAYKKLKRITGKPNFEDVYAYLKKFLEPFISNNQESLFWNTENASWITKS
jgi:hypothetical protein